jgi:hypothetical protein
VKPGDAAVIMNRNRPELNGRVVILVDYISNFSKGRTGWWDLLDERQMGVHSGWLKLINLEVTSEAG